MLHPAATELFLSHLASGTPGDEKPFSSIQDIPMMPQIYEDVVVRAVLTRA